MRSAASRAVSLAALLLLAGCLAGPRLDAPPGHRVVIGRLDISRLDATEAAIQVVADDGSLYDTVTVGLTPRDFAIALPPGRYRIVSVWAGRDRRVPDFWSWPLRLAFDVGPEPAVYIGTLQFSSGFASDVGVTVVDDYEKTLRAVRAWYPDLPATVARRLTTPA